MQHDVFRQAILRDWVLKVAEEVKWLSALQAMLVGDVQIASVVLMQQNGLDERLFRQM